MLSLSQARAAGAALVLLVLSACGGGSDPAEPSARDRESALATATPAQSQWSALRSLPLVPAAAANLPDGKVLMWSAEEKFSFGAVVGRTYSLVYDPVANTVSERTVTETGHNMFCPGTTNLADGRLLVNGGISAANTSLFNPATNTWSTGTAMNIPRGYQANTILKDGAVLTLGGSWSGSVGNKHGEVWTAAAGWRRLTGVPIDSFLSPDPSRNFGGDSHFWLIPAGNGKVFHPGPGINMHWIDATGNGRVQAIGVRGDDEFSVSGTTVMYDTGKVLKTGGAPLYEGAQANANTYVIDLNTGVSVRKTPPMAYRRTFHNSVVLPNGQVLIVGGQTFAAAFSDTNSVLVPELWDPRTETFTTLPPMAAPRNYHGVSLLLPDARVVTAGGGLCGAGCAANHPDLQILTPYYLLQPNGTPAVRPVIQTAPASVRYGQKVAVTTDSAIASFSIVRLSSTTHTVNNDQRRLPLTFRSTGPNAYELDVPSNPGWALPGDWMLFAMNADGVPSVARIVRVSMDGAPSFQPIDDAAAITGTPASLQPAVTLPAGQSASYSASGLPPGLAIDAASGRISGTPTLAGRYPVSVRATTGAGVTVSTEFVWTVDSAAALVFGLKGEYFVGRDFTGTPVRAVTEAVDFDWGFNAPGAGVPVDNFAVRWTGWLRPSASGSHVLQTLSDDGVRVWVNDVLVINNWTDHAPTLNNSAALALTAGVRVPIRIEYYDAANGATMRLRWTTPTNASFTAIPSANLQSTSLLPNQAPTIAAPALPNTFQGLPISVAVPGVDRDGDPLGYSAAGLPPGLSINASTGTVSGTPTQAGLYDVTIGVVDGRGGAAVTRFNWTVLAPAPVLLPVQTAPAASGASVSYTALMQTPSTYSYQWDFGDGTAPSAWSDSPTTSHVFANPGVYLVTVTARTSDGRSTAASFWQAVQGTGGQAGRSSSALLVEPRAGAPARVWVVNPDNDSVSVIDSATNTRVAEIAVGTRPRTLALAPDGRIWVTNHGSDSLSIISPTTLAVVQTVALPRASQPYGVVVAANGSAYVSLEGAERVLRLSSAGAVQASGSVGANVRHLALNAAGTRLLATRFISPPLPGEDTASVQTSVAGAPRGGELLTLDATTLALLQTTVLRVSDKEDTTAQGRGLPNYLGAPVIAPDGRSAWVPSKQDNVQRGLLRDGRPLDFQNSVRAISSRIDLTTGAEDHAARIDHDNSGLASAAAWHPGGAFLFVALETSRHVAVVDPLGRRELFRVDVGRAPQGLALSADGLTLYVHNFMDRTVGVHDLARLLNFGESVLPLRASVATVASDRLTATVLTGKRLFYDARDPRLARDGYMSCASCHNDGGHDGRTWDFTGFGEGLRNTIALRGRAGMGQGRLHWSGNFDEVHDFEGQIRAFAAGTGLMSDAQFNAGTRSAPLGDAKAGLSADLDALAAYLGSLSTFDASPHRNADGTLTTAAVAGRTVFAMQCVACHGSAAFTDSASGLLRNIGTIKPASGSRLGAPLTGIDPPTLRDAWATAPYLHDGSAATIEAAVQAHQGLALSAADLANVSAFVREIGREESAVAPVAAYLTSTIYGAASGTAFTDPVASGQWLTGVSVKSGYWLDSIQGLATPAHLPVRGGAGGAAAGFTLDAGEYIVRVYGLQGANALFPAIAQISFVTSNGRVFGPYGQGLGQDPTTPFDIVLPPGGRVVGFTGRAGDYLNAIGVLYIVDQTPPAVPASPIFGPPGGTLFTDPVVSGQRLTGVTVSAGYWIDAIQGLATPSNLPRRGGPGGASSSFTLPEGEYLVRVFGRQGGNTVVPAISQISFMTNTGRVYGPYGEGLGQDPTTPFDIVVPAGGRIVGFTGRAGTYLNAIGVLYVQDVAPPTPRASPIFGAALGTAFSDTVVAGQVITGVNVNAGYWIDSVLARATPADLPRRGGGGGQPGGFTLLPGEHLVRIYGRTGSNPVVPAVSQISFVTSTGRVFGPYGEGLGQDPTTPFDFTVPAGSRIVGFTGRAGEFLHAIGVLYLP